MERRVTTILRSISPETTSANEQKCARMCKKMCKPKVVKCTRKLSHQFIWRPSPTFWPPWQLYETLKVFLEGWLYFNNSLPDTFLSILYPSLWTQWLKIKERLIHLRIQTLPKIAPQCNDLGQNWKVAVKEKKKWKVKTRPPYWPQTDRQPPTQCKRTPRQIFKGAVLTVNRHMCHVFHSPLKKHLIIWVLHMCHVCISVARFILNILLY